MLMLAKVNGPNSGHFKLQLNTPQYTQNKLNMTTVCWDEFKGL